ncbi:hypothetical protein ACNQFN_02345 [Thauera butanivorans]|uniref:hypothetical protein n=1 Tax=Thauera butanivorans TaxID=86174 RepID=UPI003AB8C373
MALEAEKLAVKEMIESFYGFANVSLRWNGEVNERVAEVFGVMLNDYKGTSHIRRWPVRPGIEVPRLNCRSSI